MIDFIKMFFNLKVLGFYNFEKARLYRFLF